MSEFGSSPQGGLSIVAAVGREFDRVIERDAARRRLAWPGTRRLAAACAVALLAFAVLTAPGRDAAAWVGGLVGIGEVGGPPTREKHVLQEPGAPFAPVVVDNGHVARRRALRVGRLPMRGGPPRRGPAGARGSRPQPRSRVAGNEAAS